MRPVRLGMKRPRRYERSLPRWVRRPWGGWRRSGEFGHSSQRRWRYRRRPAGWPAASSPWRPPILQDSLGQVPRPSGMPTLGPIPGPRWFARSAPRGGRRLCKGLPRLSGKGQPDNRPATDGLPRKPSGRRGKWPVVQARSMCLPIALPTILRPDQWLLSDRPPTIRGLCCRSLRPRRRQLSVLQCHQPSRPPVSFNSFWPQNVATRFKSVFNWGRTVR